MKVGTKSVLYGAHCFFLHPFFVAWAWTKVYGFPFDPRLWVAFFVHDLGYWSLNNMDGDEGELHPFWGAAVMATLFDWSELRVFYDGEQHGSGRPFLLGKWGQLSLFHSRFLAKRMGRQPSQLCIADKLSIALTPTWLYLPMVIATGEIGEYVKLASDRRPDERSGLSGTEKAIAKRTGLARLKLYWKWHRELHNYMREWVEEHKDGREDTWTPDTRQARDETGVWL